MNDVFILAKDMYFSWFNFLSQRKFINMIVKNRGNKPASNYEEKLKILSKSEGCDWLSVIDTKTLIWEKWKN
jgi:hypothetical protein